MFFIFLGLSFFITLLPLPEVYLSWIQTFSQVAKDIILFFCPFLIFFNLTTALAQYKRLAFIFLIFIAIFPLITNGLSVLFPYFFYKEGLILTSFTLIKPYPIFFSLKKILILSPIWTFFLSLFLGLFFAYKQNYPSFLQRGKIFINSFFKKIISYLISFLILPLFSSLKDFSLKEFSKGFLFLLLLLFLQQSFLVFLVSWKRKISPIKLLKNFSEPFIFAFSSSSSLATLPLSIEALKKESLFPNEVGGLLTGFINIQQIADCLLNSFFVLFLHESFFHTLPDFYTWITFTFHFTLMRFATTGVSGGAIFLMIPLYEHYFHFTKEMLNLILTLNILFDPIVTSFNVLGNLNLTLLFEYFFKKLFLGKF